MNNTIQPKQRAVLLDSINQAATEQFYQAGYAVETFPKDTSDDDLVALAQGADVLGIRSGPRLPGELLSRLSTIQAIGCYCVGTDQVDRQTSNQEGIAVFNSPYDNGRSVAELVIGSTFALLRQTQRHNLKLHAGIWTKTEIQSYEIKDKIMGIIGYGNIGQQVGVMAESLGMEILYTDIQDRPRLGNAKARTIDDLLAQADVVTVHVPGGQNKPIIGATEISKMKSGAYIINTARAQAVDCKALNQALQTGQIAGAALDVHQDEPARQGDTFASIFRGNDRVLLTPHIGGSTQEAQKDAAASVTRKLLSYIANGSAVGAVNLPQADLGHKNKFTRVTYVHQNQPGAEAELARLLALNKINITSEVLRTRDSLGYGIYDLEVSSAPKELIKAIQKSAHHIRVRTII